MDTLKTIRPTHIFFSIVLLAVSVQTAHAKFVYAITNRADSTLSAYDIQGDQIVHHSNATGGVLNPVGLAYDPRSEILFVTYEWSNVIEMLNFETMERTSEAVPDVGELAGIVFDQTKRKLYVVERETPNLFVYSWDAGSKELTPEVDNPKTLNGLDTNGAYGLALDLRNHRLFVTDNTSTVKYYNTDSTGHTWYAEGSVDIVVDSTPRTAVGIAIDSVNRFMYTGAWSGEDGDHTCLVRTNIADLTNPVVSHEKDVDAYVIGLAVDEATHYAYITKGTPPLSYYIEVYDTANWDAGPTDIETIGQAADILVGAEPLELAKVDDVPDCVGTDDLINYTITCGPHPWAATNITVTDYLPPELDFKQASDAGQYDSGTHTVTWTISDLFAHQSKDLSLQVEVNNQAAWLTGITNWCYAQADGHDPAAATVHTPVCCPPLTNIIYVNEADQTPPFKGDSWENAYNDLQDALSHARTCGGSAIWVAAGTYKPTTDPADKDATFALVDGVPLYGGFDGTEASLDQRDWQNNETILSGDIDGDGRHDTEYDTSSYVVTASDITDGTIDGFTITMSFFAGIYSSASSITIQHNVIRDNEWDGIMCTDYSNCKIADCVIEHNGGYAVSAYVASFLELTRNKIIYNSNGANCDGATITNNWICLNRGTGISLCHFDLFRNNTIAHNTGYGIHGIGTNYGCSAVHITNSILWGNIHGGFDDSLFGGPYSATYSCVQDPQYVGDPEQTHNISTDPAFVNVWDFQDQTTGSGTETTIRVANANLYHEDPPDIIEYDNDGVARTVTGVDIPTFTITFTPPLPSRSQYGVCVYNWGPGVTDVDEDYHLKSDSLCLDAGDPDLQLAPGETDIDGAARVVGDVIDMGADEQDCFPTTYTTYGDWKTLGRPDCWCAPEIGSGYQCLGDADGQTSGFPYNYRVYTGDLNLIIENWKKKIDDPTLDPCADLDHKSSGFPYNYRVYSGDLNILIANWKKKDADLGIPGPCPTPE